MGKLLTVSVAAYNMEKYLRRTLESLAVPEVLDELEVFVVDDGGKDASLAIAQEFERAHPGSFHAVHKENGGYGTTVNWSLAHATGRYFRPLDGDDWFERDGLIALIELLRGTDADAVITPCTRVYFDGDRETGARTLLAESEDAATLAELRGGKHLLMHRITYKTDILRAVKLELPGRVLYTDNIYVCAPLLQARSVRFLDAPLYCHRIGRAEQSMSAAVVSRHMDDSLTVNRKLAGFCAEARRTDCPNAELIENFTAYLNRGMLRQLLMAPASRENLARLRQYEADIRALSPAVYEDAARTGKLGKLIARLRKLNYAPWPLLRPLMRNRLGGR